MKLFILVVLAVSTWAAPTTAPPGNVCSYPAVGDESTQKSVPIAYFRTSGLDFIRPNWCITHCSDRKSVKVAARFQLANTTSAAFKVRHTITRESGMKIHKEIMSGTPVERDDDPFNFCMDDSVSDTIDQIINQYNDLETMSEALNYYINKPGWAYMLYDMGPPPSIIETDNVHHDPNYCSKFTSKQLDDGTYMLYQVFAGLIKSDSA